MNNILAYVISFVLLMIVSMLVNGVLGFIGIPSFVIMLTCFAIGWYWPLQKIAEFIKSV